MKRIYKYPVRIDDVQTIDLPQDNTYCKLIER